MPLTILVIILKNLIPKLKERVEFERKNLVDKECRSFKRDGLKADYCFEVSSEGELEQIRPLIENFLKNQKKIELLFASPSVEKKCQKLALENKKNIRILRLPVASFMPIGFLFFQSSWQWVSAPKILFCRYDFYPELLLFKLMAKKMILLSATAKKASWFKEHAFGLFDLIVTANYQEEVYFKKLFPTKKNYSFDFRVPRIFKRVFLANKILDNVPQLNDYLVFLRTRSPETNLIMGSAWPSDLVIFEQERELWEADLMSGKRHLLIVPHSLSNESFNQLSSKLKTLFPKLPQYMISASGPSQLSLDLISRPGIVLLNMSGILCELYSLFRVTYVGGGYERSIHSVLEPYLCGSLVVCGPLIHRSTEYDFIKDLSPDEIHLLKDKESFYDLLTRIAKMRPDFKARTDLEKQSLDLMKLIQNEIELC
jgi:3-deoxy-D-manno-octulosonic-acid transferase